MNESPSKHAEQVARLSAERERLERELFRLSAALADSAALPSVLSAIREREARQAVIAEELAASESSGDAVAELADALPEAQRRLQEWRSVLTEETGQARQMLRALLEGRIVFTPRPELPAVDFAGRGNYGRLFAGLAPQGRWRPQADTDAFGRVTFIAGSCWRREDLCGRRVRWPGRPQGLTARVEGLEALRTRQPITCPVAKKLARH